jgi:hypothetical protein
VLLELRRKIGGELRVAAADQLVWLRTFLLAPGSIAPQRLGERNFAYDDKVRPWNPTVEPLLQTREQPLQKTHGFGLVELYAVHESRLLAWIPIAHDDGALRPESAGRIEQSAPVVGQSDAAQAVKPGAEASLTGRSRVAPLNGGGAVLR